MQQTKNAETYTIIVLQSAHIRIPERYTSLSALDLSPLTDFFETPYAIVSGIGVTLPVWGSAVMSSEHGRRRDGFCGGRAQTTRPHERQ